MSPSDLQPQGLRWAGPRRNRTSTLRVQRRQGPPRLPQRAWPAMTPPICSPRPHPRPHPHPPTDPAPRSPRPGHCPSSEDRERAAVEGREWHAQGPVAPCPPPRGGGSLGWEGAGGTAWSGPQISARVFTSDDFMVGLLMDPFAGKLKIPRDAQNRHELLKIQHFSPRRQLGLVPSLAPSGAKQDSQKRTSYARLVSRPVLQTRPDIWGWGWGH